MTKKCTLVILLIDEADEKTCEELAEDIKKELEESLRIIPWAKEVEKVTVSEE